MSLLRLRILQRLRLLVVCLSFALGCVPHAEQVELTRSLAAAASLVEAAGSRTARAEAPQVIAPGPGRQFRQVRRAAAEKRITRAELLVAAWPRALAMNERAPAFDGRHLYLELCTLLC